MIIPSFPPDSLLYSRYFHHEGPSVRLLLPSPLPASLGSRDSQWLERCCAFHEPVRPRAESAAQPGSRRSTHTSRWKLRRVRAAGLSCTNAIIIKYAGAHNNNNTQTTFLPITDKRNKNTFYFNQCNSTPAFFIGKLLKINEIIFIQPHTSVRETKQNIWDQRSEAFITKENTGFISYAISF